MLILDHLILFLVKLIKIIQLGDLIGRKKEDKEGVKKGKGRKVMYFPKWR
jgi:hypothetical protein